MAMLRAALYCRLSKDDMLQGDSESIKTQKAMLTQYAKEHGFLVVEIYVDDGYSGLNFDRPSFNRMLDDIEAGKIDVVITKDLSRLGRDHLKVGHFTEIYFPVKNVRYIAVNDGVDTANKNNDIAALKNVMNEFYSRDNSRKIRSSIRARAKAGLYRSSFNPIGYRKSPDNHNKLIVDEETAWIVKRIYLYVPAKNEQRRAWGELSGYKKEICKRNERIVSEFRNGETVASLAERYHLSVYAIRKIIYQK